MYQFLEEPPYQLKCAICLAVARQPQQHGECGKLFCMSCLTQHKQFSSRCPVCDSKLNSFYDGRGEQEINALKVRCDYLKNGCPWTGELGSLHTHTRRCGYITISCPNNCKGPLNLLQKDLATHQEVCPARTHQCPHCHIMGSFEELATSHLDICPKVDVYCPHPACTMMIKRCYLKIHISTCQNILYPCKYANVGCPAQLKLADLQQHEEDDQLHLQITMEKVLELTELLEMRERKFTQQTEQMDREIAVLRQRTAGLDIATAPVVFAVSNFREHQKLKNVVYSPSFYLATRGYKVYVAVFPNGRGEGKNSHLSVFVQLTKGDNDDSLTWPFQGVVTVKLLNQTEDRYHISAKMAFQYNEKTSGRPMDGKKEKGYGYEKFIWHKQIANSQLSGLPLYLKNDKLYFHVSV